MATHYEMLGVSPDASDEEIKKAYLKRSRAFHPDVNHDPAARDMFTLINVAHDVLKNPLQRAAYDRSLKGESEPATQPQSTPTTPGAAGGGTPAPDDTWGEEQSWESPDSNPIPQEPVRDKATLEDVINETFDAVRRPRGPGDPLLRRRALRCTLATVVGVAALLAWYLLEGASYEILYLAGMPLLLAPVCAGVGHVTVFRFAYLLNRFLFAIAVALVVFGPIKFGLFSEEALTLALAFFALFVVPQRTLTRWREYQASRS